MNNKLKSIKKSMIKIIAISAVLLVIMTAYTYAAPPTNIPANTDALDKVIDWIALWAGKIGLVVAFFGGIQTALGFKNEDADAKVRGLKTLVSGFMVFGVTQSLSMFGL